MICWHSALNSIAIPASQKDESVAACQKSIPPLRFVTPMEATAVVQLTRGDQGPRLPTVCCDYRDPLANRRGPT
jgi:hypothetical protein